MINELEFNKILNSSQDIFYSTRRKNKNNLKNYQEENKKEKTRSENEKFKLKDYQSIAYRKSTSFNYIVQNHYFLFIENEYSALAIY